MRLQTSIPPRRDGTLIRKSDDGLIVFTFRLDECGDLTCDVTDEATVARLLAEGTGEFFPVDEADHVAAAALMGARASADADQDADKDGEGGEDDEEADQDALPIEANTPVRPTKAAVKAKAKAQARGK